MQLLHWTLKFYMTILMWLVYIIAKKNCQFVTYTVPCQTFKLLALFEDYLRCVCYLLYALFIRLLVQHTKSSCYKQRAVWKYKYMHSKHVRLHNFLYKNKIRKVQYLNEILHFKLLERHCMMHMRFSAPFTQFCSSNTANY